MISGSAVQGIFWSVCLFPDVLRFDNTYSIFQAKRVSFTVEVLLPDHLQSPKTNGGVQQPVVTKITQCAASMLSHP